MEEGLVVWETSRGGAWPLQLGQAPSGTHSDPRGRDHSGRDAVGFAFSSHGDDENGGITNGKDGVQEEN